MGTVPYRAGRLTLLRTAIILLAAATAGIHLLVAILDIVPGALPVFLLNALGYLSLTSVSYAPFPVSTSLRAPARWMLLGYTALTILLWVLGGPRIALAYADKAIEAALIVLMLVDARQERAQAQDERARQVRSTKSPATGTGKVR